MAWVELLSPSNKGGSADAQTYRVKRMELIRNGLVFIELDYLHETSPTFWRLADYTLNEPNAHAYRIIIIDPRPTFKEGRAYLRQFDVDAPVPVMTIPLSAGDKLDFDFGVVYQKAFQEALYGYDMDYAELPMNFERYSKDDQTRIAARMLSVLEAASSGIDLETGSLAVKDIVLDAALEQIEALKKQILS